MRSVGHQTTWIDAKGLGSHVILWGLGRALCPGDGRWAVIVAEGMAKREKDDEDSDRREGREGVGEKGGG